MLRHFAIFRRGLILCLAFSFSAAAERFNLEQAARS